ncbi:mono/diheme cytochrome c family protein [Pseudomonas nitritireducens]|uniref:Mono/diheme cytochrome c family protein n=1 Tax=Pseudomonas nitroreducens TaxID=46680 RepID=A0A7W7KSN4_PSENT|nr:cytochrome c [Pseudomonas nitritireducens]MBB4867894.1 mono/diheme cytochrome c family protein [Pseudomonas nitritireducens]
MKTLVLLLALQVLLATGAVAAPQTPAIDGALLERGRYLALLADCQACHSRPGGQPYAGGYEIATPLGPVVASNITPALRYGIGSYSEAQFAAALRQGKRADGANLYPAMPYTAYRGLSDADVHALYAYFRNAVLPVEQAAAASRLPFPFSWRPLMGLWNALFLGSRETTDTRGGQLAHGRYLVDTLGHCGSCHTPRNLLMAEIPDSYLGGAEVAGWYAPNITSDRVSGIGDWSADELVQYLRTGHLQGRGQAGGGMAEAVSESLRHFDEADLQAMAAYLRSVPPIHDPQQSVQRSAFAGSQLPPTGLEPLLDRQPASLADSDVLDGSRLYNAACASCHQIDGAGTADQFYPSLSHNGATGDVHAGSLVMAILRGVQRHTNDYQVAMPAFADQLDDGQVAALSNYVLQRFGNPALQVSAAQVGELRAGGAPSLLLRALPYALLLLLLGVLLAGAAAGRWLLRRR